MPDVDQYAPGTPSWIDVTAPDLDAAAAFYGGLFGWEAEETSRPEESGGYRMFTLRGREVAGLGPLQDGGPPPMWTTYVTVADADATARRRPPTAARSSCRRSTCSTSAAWPSSPIRRAPSSASGSRRAHPGARIVNEPGSLIWNELAVRETGPEISFYEAVFGWGHETARSAASSTRPGRSTRRRARPVAGMIRMDENWPAEVPPHWLVYLAVADVDARLRPRRRARRRASRCRSRRSRSGASRS